MSRKRIEGPRSVVTLGDDAYPELLARAPRPPEKLYVIGALEALEDGLAVIGARKATPYGLGCAERFARIAAEKGIVIVSGGAYGCDAQAHRAALAAQGTTVVVLGGGCDEPYPARHVNLFQQVVNAGGAIVSEYDWDTRPMPFMFRERNRIIAGLARAVLIVEAGLPSGTFSTADEALGASREVLVVPGSITSPLSRGANRLILQGATPVIDDESFEDTLLMMFGALKRPDRAARGEGDAHGFDADDKVIAAICAQPLYPDELLALACQAYGSEDARVRLAVTLAQAEAAGVIARQFDGRWASSAAHRARL